MMSEQLDKLRGKKMNIDAYLTPHTKINSGCVIVLYIKALFSKIKQGIIFMTLE